MKKFITLLLAAVLVLSFAACEQKVPEPVEPEEVKIASEDLKAAIEGARDAELNDYIPVLTSVNDPGAQQVLTTLSLNTETMECYALSVSLINIKAYGIVLVKPVEGQEEAVKTALEEFVESTRSSFENYLPAQAEIANAATVETLENSVIMMIMSEEHDTVRDAVAEAVLNPAPAEPAAE